MSNLLEIRTALGVTQEQFAHGLGISVQTVSRWERQKHTPGRRAKQRIEAIGEVARLAQDVLEPDRIRDWFTTPNALLGGIAPLDVLQQPGGIDRVRNLLGRIEWGITA